MLVYAAPYFYDFSNGQGATRAKYTGLPDMFNDYLLPVTDSNSVYLTHFFTEGRYGEADGYQTEGYFLENMTKAVADFKDKSFQLVTFNGFEQTKFGKYMPDLGFKLLGDSPGNHNTPIYLWVKTQEPE